MVLYVDETENEKFFIVSGLLVNSEQEVELAYNKFKKRISGMKISTKQKDRIFTEFKSSDIDYEFQRIKRMMLKTISEMNCKILYAAHLKTGNFGQQQKETIYIRLLIDIISRIDDSVKVYFDNFNNTAFKTRIINTVIHKIKNLEQISAVDSERCHGIQFADNICSVIRHKQMGIESGYYEIIKKCIDFS